MVSFWEQQSLLQYDVIIVGAGITGLSTAASLKESQPDLNILVIERGTLPSGASTKNAGFACFGSISELAGDRRALGDDGMVKLVNRRWKGLQKTINRLGAEKIGFLQKGGYELLNNQNIHHLEAIDQVNDLLSSVFPEIVFTVENEKIKEFGLGQTQSLVYNQYEGQLNTGELIRNLWLYCSQLGIQIITGTEVKQILPDGEFTTIVTPNFQFKARAAALCTNAFTQNFMDIDLSPGRGMVMAITPSKPLKLSGTFHYDEGYFYFRDFHGKLIYGGGRNLAMEDETTTSFGINAKIEARLHRDLKEIILPNTDYQVDMKWSGIMAFGPTKTPILKKTEDGLFVGVRLGGMGVALGSLLGEELAQLIISDRF